MVFLKTSFESEWSAQISASKGFPPILENDVWLPTVQRLPPSPAFKNHHHFWKVQTLPLLQSNSSHRLFIHENLWKLKVEIVLIKEELITNSL